MANRRITDLPGITSVDIVDADLFTVVDVSEVDPGLKNKKFTVAEHKAYLNNYYLQLTGGTINSDLTVGGNLIVSGNTTLEQDLTVSGTGYINSFVTSGITSTGLISGVTITGTSILGINVNGNNGSFTSLQATNTALVNATATNFSGAAITGDIIRASGITGQVISGDNVYGVNISGTTISGQTGIFTSSLSGALISGVSGVFTSHLSGQTITGNSIQGTTGTFSTVSGNQFIAGGVTFVSGSGDVRPRGLFSFPTIVGSAGYVLSTNADGTTSWIAQNSAGYSGGDFTIYSGNLIVSGNAYISSGLEVTGTLSGTTITGNTFNGGTANFNVLSANTFNFNSTFTGNMTASGSGIFGSGLLTSGDLTVSGSGIFGSGIVLMDADKSNWISLNCAPVVPSNVIWTLPSGDATLSGYALISDTSGNLSWGESIPRSTFTGNIIVSGSGTFGSGIRTSGSLAVSGSGTFGSGIVFPDADASNWVAFKAATTVPSNVTWTLPSGDATVSGYALISDASGNLTWGEAGGGGAFPSGSAAAPSISVGTSSNGLYSPATNQLSFSTSGTERFRVDSNGQLEAASLGTAAVPVFTFTTDPDTGFYSPGTNQFAIATSGSGRLSVAENGVTTVQNGAVAVIGTLTDGATITPDFAANCNFTLTITGSRTVANPTNITAGQTGSIFIIQGSGSNTLSWGSYWDFPGGTPPTLSTASGAIDRVDYVVRSSTSIHTVFTANYS